MTDRYNPYVDSRVEVKTIEDQPVMIDGNTVSVGDYGVLRDQFLAGNISAAQVRKVLASQLTLTTALRRNRGEQ